MDTANLTFAQIAISLFGGLLSVGLGLVAGFRFIPAVRSLSSRTPLDRGSRTQLIENAEAGRILPTEIAGLDAFLLRALPRGVKEAASEAARDLGVPRKRAYQRALDLKDRP